MALEKRISELTAKSGAIEDTDLMVISDYNGSTYDTKKVTGAQINPYKIYLANISQTSTSAPTVNYSYSELSGTLTFARSSIGTYTITNSVADFTAIKTFVLLQMGIGAGVGFYQMQFVSTTQINLYTFDYLGAAADSLLSNSCLEIKIIK